MEWITMENIKNLFNTVFFITTGTVAIFTYRQARKTVLQPLRTEVFKEQIRIMGDVLEIFNGKNQSDLRDDFDFNKIFKISFREMANSYARIFFNVEPNQPRDTSEFPQSIIDKSYFEKNFSLADNDLIEDDSAASREQVIYSEIEAMEIWSDYQLGMVHVSKDFLLYRKKILKLSSNPLIPTELSELLDEYLGIIRGYIREIDNVITMCAKEMPERYKTINSLENASSNWIYASYPKDNKLEDCAKKIIIFIREYFDTDNLTKR
ncbi:hypothetical protein MH138_05180 [Bacillus safensis]|uniref:hypothetical protein n=1 Tax=Bacillus TaxID=1386 RepID=UPI0011A65E43|nr:MULTISPECIES: hypothetical protein [Bacillus]MCY7585499.1 hypothetical protein [Bacillus safensis]MCY7586934.1 hypothetical protein [Bacillus safensis]MCY7610059.1 hypothetical protein [Bacillus safensis]